MSNQEEDATDLNFPKGASPPPCIRPDEAPSSPRGRSVYGLRCGACNTGLTTPLIQCDECPQVMRILNSKIKTTNVLICLECFSSGAQFGVHKNDHKYVVVRDDFILFDRDWKASEEILFLDAIKVSGLCNWEAVSSCMKYTKTEQQCKEHFDKLYGSKQFPGRRNRWERKKALPHGDGLKDPPRPVVKVRSHYELAGYNPARAEFEVEHDNEAEQIVAGVELDNSGGEPRHHKRKRQEEDEEVESLHDELVYALAGCYQTRLKERKRRKRIIARHGLISQDRALVHFNEARTHLPLELVKLFPKLHQLMSFSCLSRLVEGFKLEAELKERGRMLTEYRRNGLTRLTSATVYEDLHQVHLSHLRERRTLLGPSSTDQSVLTPDTINRKPVPLDIVGSAGYERLDDEERRLASEIRLMPHDFIRFKNLLTMECKKRGGLSLAQARLGIKIDVNKTRKIYDLMIRRNELY